jgi:hypothetical protein
MRRVIALGLSLLVGLAGRIEGQQPEKTSGGAAAERPASRPSVPIRRMVQDLPSGEGFAASYPGDQCIRSDRRVIFSEDFDGRDPFTAWSDWKSPENVRLTDRDRHSGYFALAIEADLETNRGGHLFKRLPHGEDVLHVRFYVKFVGPAEYVQHFVQISADEPPRPFLLGGAGVCPDGGMRFATAIEPFGSKGRFPAPGAWHLHSYWCEMSISDDGKYWGNDFAPEEPVLAVADRWICVEVMVKANSTPFATDGAQAFWIDGNLCAAFEGYRWRTDPKLKLNGIALLDSMTAEAARRQGSQTPIQKTTVLFDDLVVATRYIGPQRPLPEPTPSPASSTHILDAFR